MQQIGKNADRAAKKAREKAKKAQTKADKEKQEAEQLKLEAAQAKKELDQMSAPSREQQREVDRAQRKADRALDNAKDAQFKADLLDKISDNLKTRAAKGIDKNIIQGIGQIVKNSVDSIKENLSGILKVGYDLIKDPATKTEFQEYLKSVLSGEKLEESLAHYNKYLTAPLSPEETRKMIDDFAGFAITKVGKLIGLAGNPMYKNSLGQFKNTDLTNVGRALTKHPEVVGATKETLRQSLRTDAQLNRAAVDALKNIMINGVKSTATHPRYGNITTYLLKGGFGARFNTKTNEFIGFINP